MYQKTLLCIVIFVIVGLIFNSMASQLEYASNAKTLNTVAGIFYGLAIGCLYLASREDTLFGNAFGNRDLF